MVTPKALTKIGQVFAILIIVFAMYHFAKGIPQLANDHRNDLTFGLISMGFNLAWILMTFGCLVSVKKKHLQFAKIYYTFYIVSNLGGIILYIINLHTDTKPHEKLNDFSLGVWIVTLIITVVALIFLAISIWILNGVIRYIESENEALQRVAKDATVNSTEPIIEPARKLEMQKCSTCNKFQYPLCREVDVSLRNH